MRLTEAGELVLTRARALLADFRSMTMELDAYKSGTGGHLRLGIIPFVPGLLIGKMIAGLTGEKHRMSVSLTEGSTTQLLEDLRMTVDSADQVGLAYDTALALVKQRYRQMQAQQGVEVLSVAQPEP